MKKFKDILFSMELTGILLLLFTISIGFATFVENDFGTLAAKAQVYNAKWFEIMLLLLAVNMTGSIFQRKMYLKHKWTILLFHVAFLIIFIGAAATRYIGYEGIMSIREGSVSNEFRSDETFIRIWTQDGIAQEYKEKKIFPTPDRVSKFNENFSTGTHDVDVEVVEYFTNAAETYGEEEGGIPVIWLVMSGGSEGRQNMYLKQGQIKHFNGLSFGFDVLVKNEGISFFAKNNTVFLAATDSVNHINMAANTSEVLVPDSMHAFEPMNLYKFGSTSIVLKQYLQSAVTKLVSTEGQEGMSSMDAFTARVKVDGESTKVNVFGGKGYLSRNAEVEIGGVKVLINYGSKVIQLPFSIKLDDFQLERYPGSNSPSSYASEVTVIDEERDLVMPFRIFMNNVLNYGGYRFFQSSYDRDELGTVLSVNHDAAGTIITYIGYFLLSLGMFLTIFSKQSRFKMLVKLSSRLRESRKEVLIVLISLGFAFSIHTPVFAQVNNRLDIPEVDADHAKAFGKLLVQDRDGRIKPLNTVSSEVLRKIARKTSIEGMSPEQVFLGIMAFPQEWQKVPMIKMTHPQLKDFLSVEGNLAAFNQIVDLQSTGQYKISEYVERAYAKKPASQSKFDKDVMQVDERVNVFYMVYSGTFLTIFPIPADKNYKWVTSANAKQFNNEEESLFVGGILGMYFEEVRKAVTNGEWATADEHLDYLLKFQEKYGAAVMPSATKVNMEVFYNEFNIFKRLSGYYGIIGFVLIILHFISILRPKIKLQKVIRISSYLVVVLFLLHTAGLIMRWNISGHAPWSNGYESMIYIAWATILSGLIFVRRSEITLSVTALLSSLILSVAGMSWMDPEITNLVPVLKSYWLIVHVAIITASYGFLALGALLGFLNLLLMNLKSKRNYKRLNLTITELSYIIEMTLIIGLFMLTIGTFLGGVWANESWGRYWGWDPKETWALATVVFYSFVVHMRFIPGFRGNFAFSFAALISYSFVMMTYFGVNYYLSGLHSYAAGDPVPVPNFVYYTFIIIGVVSIMAFIADRKYKGNAVKEQVNQ